MKRLDYLDRAKGVLVMLMVVGHVFDYGYVSNVIYVFHMPAFFAISGILLNYTNACQREYKKFVISRLYSFGIPFLIYEATGPITDIMLNGATLNIKGYIYNTLTLSLNNTSMWFLISLFSIEVIFVGLSKLIKDKKTMIFISVVFLLISSIMPTENSYLHQLSLVFRNYFFFAMGFYFLNVLTKKNVPVLVGTCAVVLATAAIFGRRTDGVINVGNLVFLIGAIAGTYAIIQLCKPDFSEKISKALSFIGQNTLVIYGTHHLYYIAVGLLFGIRDYHTTPVLIGIAILLIVAILEIPTIYIINRWLPFLAGKHYKRKVKNA